MSKIKTLGLLLSFLLIATTASSQWSTSGNDIYNSNTGNVGIGTSSPAYKLDLNGTLKVQGAALFNGNVKAPSFTIGDYVGGTWEYAGSRLSLNGSPNTQ